jgi:tripartite-type tricarboxylate transporter receptor subunit TctC
MIRSSIMTGVLAVTIAAASGAVAHAADAVADFYRGKTITFTVTYGAGGTYDLYSRLVAQHMPAFIPGKPTIVVKYMPGASGLTGSHYLYDRAARDGTEVGMVPREIVVQQILRPQSLKLDSSRLNWIGGIASYSGVMFVMTRAGVRTIEEARRKTVIAGSWGKGTESYTIPVVLNALAGTKFKIVAGYRGAADTDLAIERGEVDARIASWASLRRQDQKQIAAGKIALLYQTGNKPHPDLPKVPLLKDLATTPQGKNILAFLDSSSGIGWSVTAPPGVPPDRVAALRRAFDRTVADPAFRADATKRKLDVIPSTGQELTRLVKETLSIPPNDLAMAKKLTGQ